MRITALDTTRATEQTAIILSHLLGKFPKKPGQRRDGPKILAWQSMLGYVRLATLELGQMKLAFDHLDQLTDGHYLDEIKLNKPGNAFPRFYAECDLHREFAAWSPYNMEYVFSPVDGATALYRGLAGAVSVLAGGPPGSFIKPEAKWYLVVATAPGLGVAGSKWDPAKLLDGQSAPLDVSELLRRLIPNLLETQIAEKDRQSFSTSTLLALDGADPVAQVCSQFSRLRVTSGSPVANALAVYALNSTFDMFTAVVKGAQAALIAVAARTTGGGFYAFQVETSKPDQCLVSLPVYHDDHFVSPEKDVFLNVTGISHSAILEGVRFDERDDNVTTQTLSFRALTQSQRRVAHLHDHPSRKRFHIFNEKKPQIEDLGYADIMKKVIANFT
ncbi:MAG TPA: fructose-bisphosphatase class II [Gemmataceae bacterium]|nr:fructose-bisphosphatase class II [Gemmataceae bacterium]